MIDRKKLSETFEFGNTQKFAELDYKLTDYSDKLFD